MENSLALVNHVQGCKFCGGDHRNGVRERWLFKRKFWTKLHSKLCYQESYNITLSMTKMPRNCSLRFLHYIVNLNRMHHVQSFKDGPGIDNETSSFQCQILQTLPLCNTGVGGWECSQHSCCIFCLYPFTAITWTLHRSYFTNMHNCMYCIT